VKLLFIIIHKSYGIAKLEQIYKYGNKSAPWIPLPTIKLKKFAIIRKGRVR
jgi:hypothetical protein